MREASIWLLEHWHDLAYFALVIALIWRYVYHSIVHRKTKTAAAEMPLLLLLIFVAVLALRVEQIHSDVSGQLKVIHDFEQNGELERIEGIRKDLDPTLDAVFGDHITGCIGNLVSAVRSRRIEIFDIDEFRSLYKATLRKFPRSEFLATSIPTKAFFWRDPSVSDAIGRFIKGGGRMQRIFFIPERSVQRGSEAWEIMALQESIGVKVYTAYIDDVPRDLY